MLLNQKFQKPQDTNLPYTREIILFNQRKWKTCFKAITQHSFELHIRIKAHDVYQ